MPKVSITGWRYGLQKISLTRLQVDSLGLGLKESKQNVTSILDGQVVEFNILDMEIAKKLMLEADWLGADCELIE